MTVRVILADDEGLIRSALAALLPLEGDIAVVAEASTGREALRAFETVRPDVVILDVDMPEGSGLEVAEEILAARPEQAVLILTRHARPGTLRYALRLGVRGFLGKDAEPAVIASAVIALADGGRHIDGELMTQALISDSPLTEREQEMLHLTLEGLSVAQISERLSLSAGTVRNYLSQAIQKTPEDTRQRAAEYARARRWI